MINISRVSLRSWTIAGLIAALSVLICYRWIDRPSAELVHNMVHPGGPLGPLFASLTRLPDLLTTIWFFLLILLPVLAFATHAVRRSFDLSAVMLIAGSFVFASTVKMLLKVSFGRTWPETWIHDNPSLIRDGVYGFFPFHGGSGWSAFPSGHMTVVMSFVVIGCHLWPRLAPLWLALAGGAALVLVGMNFHFISDVIAGGYIGAASAAAVIWFASRRAKVRDTLRHSG